MDHDAFERLALQESEFLQTTFLSPVLRGKPVVVRIAGAVVRMQPRLPYRLGDCWAVFAVNDFKTARYVREATLTERSKYLNLFPSIYLIPCRRENDTWYGIPANESDKRFHITGLVPIHLATEIELFQVVQVSFDGSNCWFDKIYRLQQPTQPRYLREELLKLTEPKDIDCPGLRPEQRDAYLMAYGPAIAADMEAKRDKNEDRLRAAIERAGANYQSYIERGNSYTVEYRVGGEVHRSTVDKATLEVQSAGICLSGGDKNFDLQSLVTVIREGQNRRRIVRVGDNQGANLYDPEEEYD